VPVLGSPGYFVLPKGAWKFFYSVTVTDSAAESFLVGTDPQYNSVSLPGTGMRSLQTNPATGSMTVASHGLVLSDGGSTSFFAVNCVLVGAAGTLEITSSYSANIIFELA